MALLSKQAIVPVDPVEHLSGEPVVDTPCSRQVMIISNGDHIHLSIHIISPQHMVIILRNSNWVPEAAALVLGGSKGPPMIPLLFLIPTLPLLPASLIIIMDSLTVQVTDSQLLIPKQHLFSRAMDTDTMNHPSMRIRVLLCSNHMGPILRVVVILLSSSMVSHHHTACRHRFSLPNHMARLELVSQEMCLTKVQIWHLSSHIHMHLAGHRSKLTLLMEAQLLMVIIKHRQQHLLQGMLPRPSLAIVSLLLGTGRLFLQAGMDNTHLHNRVTVSSQPKIMPPMATKDPLNRVTTVAWAQVMAHRQVGSQVISNPCQLNQYMTSLSLSRVATGVHPLVMGKHLCHPRPCPSLSHRPRPSLSLSLSLSLAILSMILPKCTVHIVELTGWSFEFCCQ